MTSTSHDLQSVLYAIKKQSSERASPFYLPNHSIEQQLREENQKLRKQLRKCQTENIRGKAKVEELQKKIQVLQLYHGENSNSNYESVLENDKNSNLLERRSSKKQFGTSELTLLLEGKQLKLQNESLTEELLKLNGKRNELQIENRQLREDVIHLEHKITELKILDKIREERFQEELDRIQPVVINTHQESLQKIIIGMEAIISFILQKIIDVVYYIFLSTVKDCENSKQISSYNIFKAYWLEMKAQKHLGFQIMVHGYKNIKKMINKYKIENDEGHPNQLTNQSNTMNQWIKESILEIRSLEVKNKKQKQTKLFRYLGLLYRSKFPIKNEKFQIQKETKAYFYDLICQEIEVLLRQNESKE